MNENIIETKKCTCGENFNITDGDQKFLDEISPVYDSKKYNIPTPTLCPKCRDQRRLSWRNERVLYKRNCDATGKNIVSMYSPDKTYKVYSQDEWWSDRWNPKDYGRDFDFTRPFFPQIKELMDEVPKLSIINFNSENSDYTNISADNRNCYLIVESSDNENSFYSYWLQLSKDSVDCSYANNSSLCYECTNVEDCFNIKYSNRCMNCSDSYYLADCYSCANCFGCVNLENAKYNILNKEVSKDKYEKFTSDFLNGTKEYKESILSEIAEFFSKNIKKEPRIKLSENCTGDYIINSKNCINVKDASEAENCRYSSDVWRNSKNAMDVNTFGRNAEVGYEALNCAVDVYGIRFSAMCWIGNSNITYSYYCANSSNLFGCVGIHNNTEYCILNKQYTKEEYEILVPKIIEHMKKTSEWGEFFPANMSPFGYNETVANEVYPLNRKDNNPKFNWSDYEPPKPDVTKVIPGSKLPENIAEIPDDILNWAIECEDTGKPFRIIKPELDFYRKHNLPIPKKHPNIRHNERAKRRITRGI